MVPKRLQRLDITLSQKLRLPPQQPGLQHAASFFAHSADSWFWLAGLGLLYLAATQEWKPPILKLMIGILITAVFVLTLKKTLKRPRPQGDWGRIYRDTDPHSFPSGHAARAALITLWIFFLGPIWLGSLMVVWTLLVDYSRIALGVHYLSDVLAGTCIGLLFGWGLYLIGG